MVSCSLTSLPPRFCSNRLSAFAYVIQKSEINLNSHLSLHWDITIPARYMLGMFCTHRAPPTGSLRTLLVFFWSTPKRNCSASVAHGIEPRVFMQMASVQTASARVDTCGHSPRLARGSHRGVRSLEGPSLPPPSRLSTTTHSRLVAMLEPRPMHLNSRCQDGGEVACVSTALSRHAKTRSYKTRRTSVNAASSKTTLLNTYESLNIINPLCFTSVTLLKEEPSIIASQISLYLDYYKTTEQWETAAQLHMRATTHSSPDVRSHRWD